MKTLRSLDRIILDGSGHIEFERDGKLFILINNSE